MIILKIRIPVNLKFWNEKLIEYAKASSYAIHR